MVFQAISGFTLWVTKPAQYLGDVMFDTKFALVIIAFVVGGYLGGILGLFVAVPVAATLRILFVYAHERIYA